MGTAAAVVVVVAALAVLAPAASAPKGVVVAPNAYASPAQTSPVGGSIAASPDLGSQLLAVETQYVQTWSDVLGAWHGQAIARIRNKGVAPVGVDPAAAKATVSSGGTLVYEGTMDAAVPPVLDAGEVGYLVVGFRLPGKPATPTATILPAVTDAPHLVELDVHGASVSHEPGRVVVTGTASNSTEHDVRSGVVGAIAIGAAGEPLAGFVDAASLGRLGAGESRPFEAADPPAPPIDPRDVDALVVDAWGRPADEPPAP